MKVMIQIAIFILGLVISHIQGVHRVFELYPLFVTLVLYLNDLFTFFSHFLTKIK